MQRSLAIEQPAQDEPGGQISWAHNVKGSNGAGSYSEEDSPGAVVAASGGGGRHR